ATGAPVVKVGAIVVPPGSILSSTPTDLTFRVPIGAVTGKISVTTVDGTAGSAGNLTGGAPPRGPACTPAAGAGGAGLARAGGSKLVGATGVTFTGAAPVGPTNVTATSLRVVVPDGALTGPVSITDGVNTGVSAASFKVAPTISGFTPASAVGGSAGSAGDVDVSGVNLRAATGAPVVKVGATVVPPGAILSSTPTRRTC